MRWRNEALQQVMDEAGYTEYGLAKKLRRYRGCQDVSPQHVRSWRVGNPAKGRKPGTPSVHVFMVLRELFLDEWNNMRPWEWWFEWTEEDLAPEFARLNPKLKPQEPVDPNEEE
jgi:hypothetical protein